MNTPPFFAKFVFIALSLLCLMPFIEAPEALALGFLFVLFFENPFRRYTGKATQVLLQFSVVGLGFGMNIHEALKAGSEGLVFTVCSIFFTLAVGFFLGKIFKIDQKITTLVSAGTAICGGSAIASVSPVIAANEQETSVSLGIIFVLNAVALFVFPVLGHFFRMDQHQFGLWCAVAIHDTSSVVGAASKYGSEALKTATAVKLERALWIIPVSLLLAFKNKSAQSAKIKIPYFIFWFIAAIIANSYLPHIQPVSSVLTFLAKRGLTLTLFLIGSGLSIQAIKKIGIRPLMLGVALWILISVGSFLVIMWK